MRTTSAGFRGSAWQGNAISRALVVFASSLAAGETEETVIVDLADSPEIVGYSIR